MGEALGKNSMERLDPVGVEIMVVAQAAGECPRLLFDDPS